MYFRPYSEDWKALITDHHKTIAKLVINERSLLPPHQSSPLSYNLPFQHSTLPPLHQYSLSLHYLQSILYYINKSCPQEIYSILLQHSLLHQRRQCACFGSPDPSSIHQQHQPQHQISCLWAESTKSINSHTIQEHYRSQYSHYRFYNPAAPPQDTAQHPLTQINKSAQKPARHPKKPVSRSPSIHHSKVGIKFNTPKSAHKKSQNRTKLGHPKPSTTYSHPPFSPFLFSPCLLPDVKLASIEDLIEDCVKWFHEDQGNSQQLPIHSIAGSCTTSPLRTLDPFNIAEHNTPHVDQNHLSSSTFVKYNFSLRSSWFLFFLEQVKSTSQRDAAQAQARDTHPPSTTQNNTTSNTPNTPNKTHSTLHPYPYKIPTIDPLEVIQPWSLQMLNQYQILPFFSNFKGLTERFVIGRIQIIPKESSFHLSVSESRNIRFNSATSQLTTHSHNSINATSANQTKKTQKNDFGNTLFPTFELQLVDSSQSIPLHIYNSDFYPNHEDNLQGRQSSSQSTDNVLEPSNSSRKLLSVPRWPPQTLHDLLQPHTAQVSSSNNTLDQSPSNHPKSTQSCSSIPQTTITSSSYNLSALIGRLVMIPCGDIAVQSTNAPTSYSDLNTIAMTTTPIKQPLDSYDQQPSTTAATIKQGVTAMKQDISTPFELTSLPSSPSPPPQCSNPPPIPTHPFAYPALFIFLEVQSKHVWIIPEPIHPQLHLSPRHAHVSDLSNPGHEITTIALQHGANAWRKRQIATGMLNASKNPHFASLAALKSDQLILNPFDMHEELQLHQLESLRRDSGLGHTSTMNDDDYVNPDAKLEHHPTNTVNPMPTPQEQSISQQERDLSSLQLFIPPSLPLLPQYLSTVINYPKFQLLASILGHLYTPSLVPSSNPLIRSTFCPHSPPITFSFPFSTQVHHHTHNTTILPQPPSETVPVRHSFPNPDTILAQPGLSGAASNSPSNPGATQITTQTTPPISPPSFHPYYHFIAPLTRVFSSILPSNEQITSQPSSLYQPQHRSIGELAQSNLEQIAESLATYIQRDDDEKQLKQTQQHDRHDSNAAQLKLSSTRNHPAPLTGKPSSLAGATGTDDRRRIIDEDVVEQRDVSLLNVTINQDDQMMNLSQLEAMQMLDGQFTEDQFGQKENTHIPKTQNRQRDSTTTSSDDDGFDVTDSASPPQSEDEHYISYQTEMNSTASPFLHNTMLDESDYTHQYTGSQQQLPTQLDHSQFLYLPASRTKKQPHNRHSLSLSNAHLPSATHSNSLHPVNDFELKQSQLDDLTAKLSNVIANVPKVTAAGPKQYIPSDIAAAATTSASVERSITATASNISSNNKHRSKSESNSDVSLVSLVIDDRGESDDDADKTPNDVQLNESKQNNTDPSLEDINTDGRILDHVFTLPSLFGLTHKDTENALNDMLNETITNPFQFMMFDRAHPDPSSIDTTQRPLASTPHFENLQTKTSSFPHITATLESDVDTFIPLSQALIDKGIRSLHSHYHSSPTSALLTSPIKPASAYLTSPTNHSQPVHINSSNPTIPANAKHLNPQSTQFPPTSSPASIPTPATFHPPPQTFLSKCISALQISLLYQHPTFLATQLNTTQSPHDLFDNHGVAHPFQLNQNSQNSQQLQTQDSDGLQTSQFASHSSQLPQHANNQHVTTHTQTALPNNNSSTAHLTTTVPHPRCNPTSSDLAWIIQTRERIKPYINSIVRNLGSILFLLYQFCLKSISFFPLSTLIQLPTDPFYRINTLHIFQAAGFPHSILTSNLLSKLQPLNLTISPTLLNLQPLNLTAGEISPTSPLLLPRGSQPQGSQLEGSHSTPILDSTSTTTSITAKLIPNPKHIPQWIYTDNFHISQLLPLFSPHSLSSQKPLQSQLNSFWISTFSQTPAPTPQAPPSLPQSRVSRAATSRTPRSLPQSLPQSRFNAAPRLSGQLLYSTKSGVLLSMRRPNEAPELCQRNGQIDKTERGERNNSTSRQYFRLKFLDSPPSSQTTGSLLHTLKNKLHPLQSCFDCFSTLRSFNAAQSESVANLGLSHYLYLTCLELNCCCQCHHLDVDIDQFTIVNALPKHHLISVQNSLLQLFSASHQSLPQAQATPAAVRSLQSSQAFASTLPQDASSTPTTSTNHNSFLSFYQTLLQDQSPESQIISYFLSQSELLQPPPITPTLDPHSSADQHFNTKPGLLHPNFLQLFPHLTIITTSVHCTVLEATPDSTQLRAKSTTTRNCHTFLIYPESNQTRRPTVLSNLPHHHSLKYTFPTNTLNIPSYIFQHDVFLAFCRLVITKYQCGAWFHFLFHINKRLFLQTHRSFEFLFPNDPNRGGENTQRTHMRSAHYNADSVGPSTMDDLISPRNIDASNSAQNLNTYDDPNPMDRLISSTGAYLVREYELPVQSQNSTLHFKILELSQPMTIPMPLPSLSAKTRGSTAIEPNSTSESNANQSNSPQTDQPAVPFAPFTLSLQAALIMTDLNESYIIFLLHDALSPTHDLLLSPLRFQSPQQRTILHGLRYRDIDTVAYSCELYSVLSFGLESLHPAAFLFAESVLNVSHQMHRQASDSGNTGSSMKAPLFSALLINPSALQPELNSIVPLPPTPSKRDVELEDETLMKYYVESNSTSPIQPNSPSSSCSSTSPHDSAPDPHAVQIYLEHSPSSDESNHILIQPGHYRTITGTIVEAQVYQYSYHLSTAPTPNFNPHKAPKTSLSADDDQFPPISTQTQSALAPPQHIGDVSTDDLLLSSSFTNPMFSTSTTTSRASEPTTSFPTVHYPIIAPFSPTHLLFLPDAIRCRDELNQFDKEDRHRLAHPFSLSSQWVLMKYTIVPHNKQSVSDVYGKDEPTKPVINPGGNVSRESLASSEEALPESTKPLLDPMTIYFLHSIDNLHPLTTPEVNSVVTFYNVFHSTYQTPLLHTPFTNREIVQNPLLALYDRTKFPPNTAINTSSTVYISTITSHFTIHSILLSKSRQLSLFSSSSSFHNHGTDSNYETQTQAQTQPDDHDHIVTDNNNRTIAIQDQLLLFQTQPSLLCDLFHSVLQRQSQRSLSRPCTNSTDQATTQRLFRQITSPSFVDLPTLLGSPHTNLLTTAIYKPPPYLLTPTTSQQLHILTHPVNFDVSKITFWISCPNCTTSSTLTTSNSTNVLKCCANCGFPCPINVLPTTMHGLGSYSPRTIDFLPATSYHTTHPSLPASPLLSTPSTILSPTSFQQCIDRLSTKLTTQYYDSESQAYPIRLKFNTSTLIALDTQLPKSPSVSTTASDSQFDAQSPSPFTAFQYITKYNRHMTQNVLTGNIAKLRSCQALESSSIHYTLPKYHFNDVSAHMAEYLARLQTDPPSKHSSTQTTSEPFADLITTISLLPHHQSAASLTTTSLDSIDEADPVTTSPQSLSDFLLISSSQPHFLINLTPLRPASLLVEDSNSNMTTDVDSPFELYLISDSASALLPGSFQSPSLGLTHYHIVIPCPPPGALVDNPRSDSTSLNWARSILGQIATSLQLADTLPVSDCAKELVDEYDPYTAKPTHLHDLDLNSATSTLSPWSSFLSPSPLIDLPFTRINYDEFTQTYDISIRNHLKDFISKIFAIISLKAVPPRDTNLPNTFTDLRTPSSLQSIPWKINASMELIIMDYMFTSGTSFCSDTPLIHHLCGLDVVASNQPDLAAINLANIYQFIWGLNGKPFVYHRDLANTYIISQLRESELSSSTLQRDRYTIYHSDDTENNLISTRHTLPPQNHATSHNLLDHYAQRVHSMQLQPQSSHQYILDSFLQHRQFVRLEMSYHLILTYLRSKTSTISTKMMIKDWHFIVTPLTWQQRMFCSLFQSEKQQLLQLFFHPSSRSLQQHSAVDNLHSPLSCHNEIRLNANNNRDNSTTSSNFAGPEHKLPAHYAQKPSSNKLEQLLPDLKHKQPYAVNGSNSNANRPQKALMNAQHKKQAIIRSNASIPLNPLSSALMLSSTLPADQMLPIYYSPDQLYSKSIHQQLLTYFATYFKYFDLNIVSTLESLLSINQLHRSQNKSVLNLIDHVFLTGLHIPSKKLASFSASRSKAASIPSTGSTQLIQQTSSSPSQNQTTQLQKLFVFQQIILNAINIYTLTDSLYIVGIYKPHEQD